jgi:hypothetical protein
MEIMSKKEQKELIGLKLKDIADGIATTGFIFENEKGDLIGFKVQSNKIEVCNFKKI